jgi:hypothetical protein
LFKVKYRSYALFSRWLYKSAGIDYSDIGRLYVIDEHMSGTFKFSGQAFAVDFVFCASKLGNIFSFVKELRFFAYRLIEHIQAESLFGKSGGYPRAIFILAYRGSAFLPT